MEPTSSRRRPWLVVLLAFTAGAILGSVAVAGLAHLASRAYLFGAQLQFASEQDRMLSIAWRAGDFEAAQRHATCALEATHGEGARTFDPIRSSWSLGLALTELMIVRPNQAGFARAAPHDEAVWRAKLGVVLERIGQKEAAERELASAARLMGNADPAKVRELGLATVDVWSRVNEQMSKK